MRLLFMTVLASLGTTMCLVLSSSATVRILRRGAGPQHPHGRHCGMNEITRPARLCTYCYWNLPGSRVQQYSSQHEVAPDNWRTMNGRSNGNASLNSIRTPYDEGA